MDFKWISKERSLPQDLEDVFLFDRKEGKFVGFYYAETGRFIRTIDGSALSDVTHWMPLPPDPADVAEKYDFAQ